MAIEEIELDLSNPEHAREYISGFSLPGVEKKIEWIKFQNDGALIRFDKMTNHEAVRAAFGLRDLLTARIKELKLVTN